MFHYIKRIFFVVLLFSNFFLFSQNKASTSDDGEKYEPDFNTWSIGAGFSNLIMHGDLRSFDTFSGDAYFNIGGYIYADKMFNPILGAELKFNMSQLGGEIQKIYNTGGVSETTYYRILYAEPYLDEVLYMDGISLGMETNLIINFDNLWKRHSQKWSFSGYLGVGVQLYTSKLIIKDYDPATGGYDPRDVTDEGVIIDADFSYNGRRDNANYATSVFLNTGLGVKYRFNDKIDFEARSSIYLNNEDHLDAAITHKQMYESFFVTNIGVVYKFGKKERHAIWVQDEEIEPFELFDADNDGVADQFDKELETPKGAEVYGSGVAIDSDKDGFQDYRDKCPLEPGPAETQGCPLQKAVVAPIAMQAPIVHEEPTMEPIAQPVVEFNEEEKNEIVEQRSLLSKSIYFKSASDQLKQESYKPLNDISGIMIEYPESKYKIEGHTDSQGKAAYNLNLSNKRAKAVEKYLTDKNISSDRITSKGFGETRPIETNETAQGRQMNRRVEINFIDPNSEEGKLVYDQGVKFTKNSGVSNTGVVTTGYAASAIQQTDSDGDGVPDFHDREPNTPKESRVYGDGVSVDSDMDYVPDYRDNCPFAKGPIENQGCPLEGENNNVTVTAPISVPTAEDGDGDGVVDEFDKELDTPPNVKVYANGVAFDSDKDGLPDYKDRCPMTFGSPEEGGCPLDGDLDKDGVADSVDLCIDVKGDAAHNGCPPKRLNTNIKQELNNLAASIHFARSEGHILKSNNTLVLEKIGVLLNDFPATRVKIEVHTNNKPNLKYNLDLSKRRATAIMKYLTKVSGIAEDRLDVSGLGGTKPKYDVDSKELNAKNNRVEISLF